MKILIVDDEEDIGFILSYELKFVGHEGIIFDNVSDAQIYLEAHYDDIDAIICDFQMPKMSGLDFFLWTRSKNFQGPFYILTGEPTMDTEKLLEIGIADVLFKPQDLNKLSSLLNKYLKPSQKLT